MVSESTGAGAPDFKDAIEAWLQPVKPSEGAPKEGFLAAWKLCLEKDGTLKYEYLSLKERIQKWWSGSTNLKKIIHRIAEQVDQDPQFKVPRGLSEKINHLNRMHLFGVNTKDQCLIATNEFLQEAKPLIKLINNCLREAYDSDRLITIQGAVRRVIFKFKENKEVYVNLTTANPELEIKIEEFIEEFEDSKTVEAEQRKAVIKHQKESRKELEASQKAQKAQEAREAKIETQIDAARSREDSASIDYTPDTKKPTDQTQFIEKEWYYDYRQRKTTISSPDQTKKR